MIARHTRIRDNQILINFSPHAEGTMVEINVALLIALDEDQDGEYSRAGVRYRASNGLESHGDCRGSLFYSLYNDSTRGRREGGINRSASLADSFLNPQPSGSSTPKSGNRLLLGIIDFENCNQLRDLQDVPQPLAESG